MLTIVGDSVIFPNTVFQCNFDSPHSPYEALHDLMLLLSCSKTNLQIILSDDVLKLTYLLVPAVRITLITVN